MSSVRGCTFSALIYAAATEEEAKYVRYKDEKRERLGRVEQTPKAVG